VFSRFSRKKAQVDILKGMQKTIDLQLRTFTNHLRQISSAYEVLQQDIQHVLQDHLKIIELLEELNKKK
jgi:transposase-like protein